MIRLANTASAWEPLAAFFDLTRGGRSARAPARSPLTTTGTGRHPSQFSDVGPSPCWLAATAVRTPSDRGTSPSTGRPSPQPVAARCAAHPSKASAGLVISLLSGKVQLRLIAQALDSIGELCTVEHRGS